MASEILMPGPVCLIENIEGKLVVNQEALKILSAFTQPLIVVAIVGLYRTGKSYLMNKLVGRNEGFSVGSSVQSHTKGIWMWCVPHPAEPNHTLVLLDTEGLGDVEKGDQKNDTQIFALAILLSSTFVYNTMNLIDQRAIDLLYYVIELSNHLSTVSPPDLDGVEDAADAVSFCPDLVWTLRDFYLSLEADGKHITADDYLENSLKLKEDTDENHQIFNLPRRCIQTFFARKKCFVFNSPTHRKKLAQLPTLHNDELDLDFVQQVEDFCSYILHHSKTKNLPGGIEVNGPCLESLVLTYVNAISSGNLPSMENTVLALAQIKNSTAVQKAIAHYDQQMGQKVQLPTENLQELLNLHRTSEKEAIEVFIKNSFKDVDQRFQKELETLLKGKQDDFRKQNLEASSDHCSALLQDIFGPLEEYVKQGIYLKPGGHRLFIQKREELKAKYYQEPRKGIQAEETLQNYLQSKESMSDGILYSDLVFTAKEKERKEAYLKAEAAKADTRMLEEFKRHNQQMMEERERQHQEHLRQMEINREQQLEEQQMAMERQLQEEAEKQLKRQQSEMRSLLNEFLQLSQAKS
ncbi:guanylate-binding protein 5 [Pipistrellus kuhlii]|uniref:guanylate-binding protein 5 n=1 Tax=Pipistrellus kuhlii TaxID=59472 RepID=UPI00174F4403|nr:guanylate-binding protein 5 [Pipistrellus kuhlii]